MPSYSPSHSTKDLFNARENPPAHHLVAFSDGGARGNPGPSGYGVVMQDEAGRKVAALSEYLGHQTNNFAEYQGLIAALEYAVANGHKALKVISDSELLVRQIKGIYKVKNAALQDLHGRAKGSSGFLSDTSCVAITKKPTAWPMPPWTEAWGAWRGRRRPRPSWEIFQRHVKNSAESSAQERSNYSMANSLKELKSKCA
jgi:ribonuclease HI